MPDTATLPRSFDETVLDELVPPPGPRWRRFVLWLGFLGAVISCTWAITSGTVVPQVSTGIQQWGGSGPVGVNAFVENESPVAIEIVAGPRPRPGLELIGYTTGGLSDAGFDAAPKAPSDPFPLRLGPGESIGLTAWYRVVDCGDVDRIDPSDDSVDLRVRIADGPASWLSFDRTIDASNLAWNEPSPSSWAAAISEGACPS